MELLLFIAPGIIVPLIFTLIWKKFKLESSGITILLTIFTLMLYPLVLVELENHPAVDGPRCGLFAAAIIMSCFVFLIPFAILMQLLFNFLLLSKSKTKKQETT